MHMYSNSEDKAAVTNLRISQHGPLIYARHRTGAVLREADSCRGKLSPSRGLFQKIVLALTGESRQVCERGGSSVIHLDLSHGEGEDGLFKTNIVF